MAVIWIDYHKAYNMASHSWIQKCMKVFERGTDLVGLEDCVQVEVHSLKKYLSISNEKILKEVSRSKITENNKYGRSKEEIHKEH